MILSGGYGRSDRKCSACGNDYAIARWVGHQSINICRDCAIEVLPQLIADAIAGFWFADPNKHADHSARAMDLIWAKDRMKAAFYRSLWVAQSYRPADDADTNGHADHHQAVS